VAEIPTAIAKAAIKGFKIVLSPVQMPAPVETYGLKSERNLNCFRRRDVLASARLLSCRCRNGARLTKTNGKRHAEAKLVQTRYTQGVWCAGDHRTVR
jgi:hypothetical protein